MAFRVNNFCPVPETESCSGAIQEPTEEEQNAARHAAYLISQRARPIDMTNTGTFRDVHYYDGQLEEPFVSSREYSTEEKKELFHSLIQRFQHPIAIQMVQIISNAIGTHANIDGRNNIDCAEVLAEICTHELDDELVFFLQEQLVDNHRLGQCSQGRAWRLMQIYRVVRTMDSEKRVQDEIDNQMADLKELLDSFQAQCTWGDVVDVSKRSISFFLGNDPPERRQLIDALHEAGETCNPEKLNALLY